MGLRVSQAPSVHRALSSSLLSSGSVSSFLGTGCDTTMSPRSMSSASLLPEGCNSSFNSYGDRYAMERQSVRELRKAAQEAAAHPLPGQGAQEMTAPPLPGHGQHAAERLADEPWADDVSESFSAGGFVSGASLGASPPGSEDTLRAPATRIDHPPRYAATEGAGHPQVASESPEGPTRRDVRRPSRQAEGGDEPRTGGGTAGAAGGLAEELRFLREENARLLGRQALLEEMAAKAWADHTAEVAHEATGAVSSSIGRASGDVAAGARGPLDDVDDVPPASPPAPPPASPATGRGPSDRLAPSERAGPSDRRSRRRTAAATEAVWEAQKTRGQQEPSVAVAGDATAEDDDGHIAGMTVTPRAAATDTSLLAATSEQLATPAAPSAFSLASGSPYDRKRPPPPPPPLVRIRLSATSATPEPPRVVRLRMLPAEAKPNAAAADVVDSSLDCDERAAASSSGAQQDELEAMRMQMESLRGQLAAATNAAKAREEASHAEIEALQAEAVELNARLQRARLERTKAGLALERAAEVNRKAMMTPVQIYTVFLLGYARGRLKTQEDLQRQHDDIQMLLREDVEAEND